MQSNPPSGGETDDLASRINRAIRRLLEPIAKLMIASGVTLPRAVELLKQAMIDAAIAERTEDEVATDSHVSLLTGVHRKDVRRLRRGEAVPSKQSFEAAGALVIARWITDPAFCDEQRKPYPLSRRESADGQSFATLLRGLGLDIPASTLLDELEERGIVRCESDKLILLKRAYIAEGSIGEGLTAWEKNLQAHLCAATDNILAASPPFFEVAGHFNKLSPQSVQALDRMARRLFSDALEELNEEALRLQEHDLMVSTNKERLSFGAYTHKTTRKADHGGGSDENN